MTRITQFLNDYNRSHRGSRGRKGMSLVEIMVVIAIILTLMSVIGFGVLTVFDNSKVDTTKMTINGLAQQVKIFEVRNNKPPGAGEGLAAVFTDEEVPMDSWGNKFIYVSPGPNNLSFDIISHGKDGKEGGTGNNADIKMSEM